jgi:sugar/nucleoside kinase (ribokinase family)
MHHHAPERTRTGSVLHVQTVQGVVQSAILVDAWCFDTSLRGCHTPFGQMLDVVGVGALNVDYIASASSHRRRDPDALTEILDRFEHGVESLVEDQVTYDVLEQLGGRETLAPSLGGSAFLTIHAIAQMRLGLQLGYVGVCGRSPDPTLSAVRVMDRLGIERTAIRQDRTRTTGVCVSYISEGERTLLTSLGANEGFASYVREEFDQLATYLSRTRFIHATSFLDSESPGRLYAVIEEAKRRNAEVRLAFDPGHMWCVEQPEDAMRLLSLTDYLMLNYREFQALGGLGEFATDDAIAEAVLDRCGTNCSALVLKRYDRILMYRRVGGALEIEEFRQQPLGVEQIEDATGAGDVFAAGLLAAMTSDRMQLELGALLGMKMARHKLLHVGDRGYTSFAGGARRFLREWDTDREEQLRPRGVFIAHGASPLWRSVRDYLRDDLGLDVHYFERTPQDSNEVTAALGEYLDKCGFAVCVLANEDMTSDGSSRARQNIVHEAGLFQGRYGFKRVALLVEEGCELPSNLGGLVRHDFAHLHIDHTFTSLSRHLRRENLLVTHRSADGFV